MDVSRDESAPLPPRVTSSGLGGAWVTSGLLTTAFVETYTMVKRQAEGLTHPDSLRVPAFGGNCANWVLGHIVVARMNVLSLLGEQPSWTWTESQRYIPGSRPIIGSEGLEVERLIEDLHRTRSTSCLPLLGSPRRRWLLPQERKR